MDYGADPTAQDINGKTPLHKALEKKKVMATGLLIATGKALDVKDNASRTISLNLSSAHQKSDIKLAAYENSCTISITITLTHSMYEGETLCTFLSNKYQYSHS